MAEGSYSGKKHLIADLSALHNNNNHASLNQLINKDEYSLTYVKLDDAISGILERGRVLGYARLISSMRLSRFLSTRHCGICMGSSGMRHISSTPLEP